MKRPKRRRELPVEFSESVRQRLDSYALVASAAGVSLLALAQPADAKVVYTAKHHVIGHLGNYDRLDILRGLAAIEMTLVSMGFDARPGSAVAAAEAVFAQHPGT